MKADLVTRLRAKISHRPTKTGCRLWRGGTKFGRTTEYGKFRAAGAGSRIWNVQRLVLLIETAAAEVPPDPFEPIDLWLKRANRWYHDLGLVASHQCDQSLCCVVGPEHLIWETQIENVKRQAERRRKERHVEEKDRRDDRRGTTFEAREPARQDQDTEGAGAASGG